MPRPGLPRPRRAWSAVLALLLSVTVVVGTSGPAAAEPSEIPSASPSPSAPSTADPTPQPTPTESAAPKPAAPSATKSTGSAAPKKRAEVKRATDKLPLRLQRALALQSTGQAKAKLSTRAESSDGRFASQVFAGCVGPGGDPTNVEIVVFAETDDEFSLDYVITSPGRPDLTGTLDVADGFGDLVVEGLSRGPAQLQLSNPEGTTALTTDPIRVFDCVTTEVICQAVVITNPAGNPAVEVLYGDLADEDEDLQQVNLAPGESTRVRTNLASLDLLGVVTDNGTGSQDSLSLAADTTLAVPQDCEPEVASTALIGCSTGTSPAAVGLTVEHLATQSIRFEILNGADVVTSGSAPAGNESDEFNDTLPGLGEYRYALYLDGSDNAYERVVFRVLSCVAATATCRAVTFANPSDNPDVVVSYGSESNPTDDELRVDSGESGKVTWRQSSLTLSAAADPEADFVELATPTAAQQITVPQCGADSGNGGGSGSGSGSGDGLADTGSPTGGLLALVLGLLLSVAGGVLLARGRGRA